MIQEIISYLMWIHYTIKNGAMEHQIEGLEELYNNLMLCLAIISFALCLTIISVIMHFNNKKLSIIGVNYGTIIKFIWTISPALILILIALPSFKLLYLMNEVIDPSLVIYGEGHHWYWDYDYPVHINTEEDIIVYHTLMENASQAQGYLNDRIPGMPEYVHALEGYEGRTLRSLNITLDRRGPYTRINALTWYFHDNDPGAFFLYDPDSTPVTAEFLNRALTWQNKLNQKAIYDYLGRR